MNCKLLGYFTFLIVVLGLGQRTTAQITVTGGSTVPFLVQNSLVGQGVTVSNITPSTASLSVGFFNGVNSNIGLDSGIVMATGGIGNVPPGGFGQNYTGSCTDADLSYALSTIGMSTGMSLNNCVVIEFDFVPTTDSIQFQYVFGSIEYPGYTCSSFNDIFGFFLSGPGISGPFSNAAVNLALIPGTNTPVAINTINSGVSSTGSPAMCLAANPNFVAHSIYFVNNQFTFPQTVNYPGFTVPLTAKAQVQCGQTYHIKLAIADVSDGALNSAVFLKANSFTSSQVQISSQIHFGGNDSTLYETCGNATLYFSRMGNLNAYDTVLITTSGTAINGVDYSGIPDTIVFVPGIVTIPLNIQAFADGLNEGSELLHLTATINNPCLMGIPSEFEISITDLPAVNVFAPPDTTICPGETVILMASGNGGMNDHPLVYTWDNVLNDSIQIVSPHLTTSYIVHATDSCGIMFDTDTVTITVMPPIYASAGQDESMCIGDSTHLFASGSAYYSWSPSYGLNNPNIPNPVATPTVTTDYIVTVTDGICSHSDTMTLVVNPLPIVSATPPNQTICLSNSIVLSAQGASNYSWSPTNSILSAPTGSDVTVIPTSTTTYNVVGTDLNGCIDSTTITVYVNPPLFIEAYGDTSVCAEQLTDDLFAFATGGNGGPYNFSWTPDRFLNTPTGPNVVASPTESIVYTVTLTDNCGTPAVTDTVRINIWELPEILITIDDTADCAPHRASFTNLTTDAQSCYWEFGDGQVSTDCSPTHSFSDPGNYVTSLIVENSNGCRDTMEGINMYAWPVPTADFVMSPSTATIISPRIYFDDRSEFNVTRWHWTIGDDEYHDTVPKFHFDFPRAGDFPVTLYVENQYGCSDEITYHMIIENDVAIYVPSGFTPNQDGINEVFKAVGSDITYFHMQIFDRWGNRVFITDDINNGWDGTFKGKNAPQDTYVYVLEAEGHFEGSRLQQEGTVTLVR